MSPCSCEFGWALATANRDIGLRIQVSGAQPAETTIVEDMPILQLGRFTADKADKTLRTGDEFPCEFLFFRIHPSLNLGAAPPIPM